MNTTPAAAAEPSLATTKTGAPFEPTDSWCYRFARYTAIPEILSLPTVTSGQPFRLIELSRELLDRHLSPEQQALSFKRARSDGVVGIAASVKFYIPFIAKGTGQLVNLGAGMFRLPTPDDLDPDDVEEAAIEAGEEEAAAFEGWIYAFSFPALVKSAGVFPIKVGRTTGAVEDRVAQQCRGSATFDNPVILGRWQAKRVGAVEAAIHNVLKARGKWREGVPGTEWFDTTVGEVAEIVAFVNRSG